MAAVTLLGSTFTTTSGAKSVTATPAVGDLLLILVQVASDGTWDIPTDSQSGTYVAVGDGLFSSISPRGQLYIRTSLISSATSTTFDLANPGSDTGGGLAVIKVTGMTKVGLDAVRQYKQQNYTTPSATVATGTWASSKLTSNPVIGIAIQSGSASSPLFTPTSGYTALLEARYSTPDYTIEIQSINSGDTTSTMDWGSTLDNWACIGVELAASSESGNMFLMFSSNDK